MNLNSLFINFIELYEFLMELCLQINALELDGCPIESLGLDFTLPGYPQIELRKGGREMAVTPYNLDEYCKVG